jgi:hypothetical protein
MTTTQPTRIGKTTVAICVGLSFAQVRQGDRVVAVDADTAFGTLGARVDPHATGPLWDLAGPPTRVAVAPGCPARTATTAGTAPNAAATATAEITGNTC